MAHGAPQVIEYQMESEEAFLPPAEESVAMPAQETPGFWGLHRRFWDKLAPVRQGLLNRLWRLLTWAVSLLLALVFAFVWPLPQILRKNKEKFAAWLTDHGFSRFTLVVKLVALAGLVGGYFLIPARRRPWLYVIGAACVGLIILACYLFRSSEKAPGRDLAISEA